MKFARLAAGVLAALLIAVSASAQNPPRRIPADSLRGKFTAGQFPGVFIDDKPLRLAPGARILSTDNLTVTPNLVPAGTPVRYLLDQRGQVRTVWILSPAEARAR